MENEEQITKQVLENLKLFLAQAKEQHPRTHYALEYSAWILQEEVDELADELYKKEKDRSLLNVYTEAMQVATCAVRLVVDACLRKEMEIPNNELSVLD